MRKLYMTALMDQNSHFRRVLEIKSAALQTDLVNNWVKLERVKQFPDDNPGNNSGAKDKRLILSEFALGFLLHFSSNSF
jgi:hypothetical protein